MKWRKADWNKIQAPESQRRTKTRKRRDIESQLTAQSQSNIITLTRTSWPNNRTARMQSKNHWANNTSNYHSQPRRKQKSSQIAIQRPSKINNITTHHHKQKNQKTSRSNRNHIQTIKRKENSLSHWPGGHSKFLLRVNPGVFSKFTGFRVFCSRFTFWVNPRLA